MHADADRQNAYWIFSVADNGIGPGRNGFQTNSPVQCVLKYAPRIGRMNSSTSALKDRVKTCFSKTALEECWIRSET